MFAGYGPPTVAPGIMDDRPRSPEDLHCAARQSGRRPGRRSAARIPHLLGGGDVPEPPLHATTTYRRKALAEWIASPENPLFARVMVNRFWQFHFGSGLVRTPSDFGIRAGAPSHPELLDWLATEFVARNWSLKAMHQLIMTSETYQRSANAFEGGAREGSRTILLLSHMNRRAL